MARRLGFLVLILCIYLLCNTLQDVDAGKKRKRRARDLTEQDLERIEKEWEAGDEPEELTDEFQEAMKRKEAQRMPLDDVLKKAKESGENAHEVIAEHNGGGVTMMFANLWEDKDDGTARTKEDNNALTDVWYKLFKTGMVDAKVYVIDEKSILVSSDGSDARRIKDFLIDRPEVKEVTWNSRTYPSRHTKPKGKKGELPNEDEDDLDTKMKDRKENDRKKKDKKDRKEKKRDKTEKHEDRAEKNKDRDEKKKNKSEKEKSKNKDKKEKLDKRKDKKKEKEEL